MSPSFSLNEPQFLNTTKLFPVQARDKKIGELRPRFTRKSHRLFSYLL
jgi:hypothetical protein